MHDISYLFPMNRSCLPPALRPGRPIALLARCSLLLLALSGCQATPATDPQQPLPELMSNADLTRTSKADFQLCVDAFYTDDWKQAEDLAQRMTTLGQRWQGQTPPKDKQKEFVDASAGFTAAAGELKAALEGRNVEKTTASLKKLATHLAVLEKMP